MTKVCTAVGKAPIFSFTNNTLQPVGQTVQTFIGCMCNLCNSTQTTESKSGITTRIISLKEAIDGNIYNDDTMFKLNNGDQILLSKVMETFNLLKNLFDEDISAFYEFYQCCQHPDRRISDDSRKDFENRQLIVNGKILDITRQIALTIIKNENGNLSFDTEKLFIVNNIAKNASSSTLKTLKNLKEEHESDDPSTLKISVRFSSTDHDLMEMIYLHPKIGCALWSHNNEKTLNIYLEIETLSVKKINELFYKANPFFDETSILNKNLILASIMSRIFKYFVENGKDKYSPDDIAQLRESYKYMLTVGDIVNSNYLAQTQKAQSLQELHNAMTID